MRSCSRRRRGDPAISRTGATRVRAHGSDGSALGTSTDGAFQPVLAPVNCGKLVPYRRAFWRPLSFIPAFASNHTRTFVMTLWKKVRLREVVYTLSPFEQDVMSTYFKDIPYKASKLWNLWGFDFVAFCVVPYYATVTAANYIVDQEEKHHRY